MPQRFTKVTTTHLKFEKRSRKARPRFLQSFALPDETIILKETAEGTSYKMVRSVFWPFLQVQRTICPSVSLRASTRVSPDFVSFSGTVHHPATGADARKNRHTDTRRDTDTKTKQKTFLLSEMVLAQLPSWWKLRSRIAAPRAQLRDQASHVRSHLAAGRVRWHPDIDSLSSTFFSLPLSQVSAQNLSVITS